MQMLELAIWSAAAGAIALVILMGVVDAWFVRRFAALQPAAYNASALAFVVLLSGIARALTPPGWDDALRVAQVLIGPVCVAQGNLYMRSWLGARQRDKLMDRVLLGTVVGVPALAVMALSLPAPQQLPVAAVLVVANTVVTVWMNARAWLLGDRLALGVALGSLLMIAGVGGLYALALGAEMSIGLQALIAAAGALCVAVIGLMVWQRNQYARRVRGVEHVHSQYDAVTKLPGGMNFVQRLVRAQRRRKLTRRDGAVIAVILFAPERIAMQAGAAGLNEVYLHLATRLQRQVGVVNPVGRYWERCFVALVEAIHSPAAMRTLGLRIAVALRRPIQVTGAEGRPVQVRVDIGVGVVHLAHESAAVEDLLHEAQELAEAARAMRSRAATRDPATGDVVPVEHAQLGGRRRHNGHGHPATAQTRPVALALRRA